MKMTEEEAYQLCLQDPKTAAKIIVRVFEMEDRIKDLERRLNMDSSNSSKPPSSDSPFKEKKHDTTSDLKVKRIKKRGGQKGQKGKTLQLNAHPDTIEKLIPQHCSCCNKSLNRIPASQTPWRRQIIDLPRTKLYTTEYQSFSKQCPTCHTKTYGEFPLNIKSRIQYGENITALCTYLCMHQMVPIERIGEMTSDLFGQAISAGAIDSMLSKTHHSLKDTTDYIRDHLMHEEVLHCDETGVNIKGKLHWLHDVSSNSATLYSAHTRRGKEGIDSNEVLETFSGVVVHDHWSAYRHYDKATHAYCNAHILRELTGVIEQENFQWAKDMKNILKTIYKTVKKAKSKGKEALSKGQKEIFLKAYNTIVQGALSCYDPPQKRRNSQRGRPKQLKSKNLLDRLINYQEETLRFMTDFRVPFTNNLAERDLRMSKVKLKISGCFMSYRGAERFAVIRSYISTLKKNGEAVLKRLQEALMGQVYLPAAIRGG